MKKLLKKATVISTTALLLCLTNTTNTTFPMIATETETIQITEDMKDNLENKENKPEIQPLSDRKNSDGFTTEIPFP